MQDDGNVQQVPDNVKNDADILNFQFLKLVLQLLSALLLLPSSFALAMDSIELSLGALDVLLNLGKLHHITDDVKNCIKEPKDIVDSVARADKVFVKLSKPNPLEVQRMVSDEVGAQADV